MKLQYLLIIVLSLHFSCKGQAPKLDRTLMSESFDSEKTINPVAYFPNALTYQYEQNGEIEELWLYVNEDTQEVLFVPNDEMVHAVISYPDGTYKLFATDERGKSIVLQQSIDVHPNDNLDPDDLKPIKEKRIISQANIQQKDIQCLGYYLKYLKMEGGETLYVTNQIPINSYQIYGFSQLDGDSQLPVDIDYRNFFKQSEIITHIVREGFSLRLLNYGPNPYEFDLKPYQN